jgi:hypothetical protein
MTVALFWGAWQLEADRAAIFPFSGNTTHPMKFVTAL